MRRSFVVLFDYLSRATFFPSEHHIATDDMAKNILGHHPWEFAHPNHVDVIKESFARCLETGTPDFHVAMMDPEDPIVSFPGQRCCCWLTPVNAPHACGTPCVAVMAKCVLVPQLFLDLTVRQRELLGLIAEGTSPNDIAERWGITRTAVDTHLSRIRSTLDLADLLQVAVWATTYRDILDTEVVAKIATSMKVK